MSTLPATPARPALCAACLGVRVSVKRMPLCCVLLGRCKCGRSSACFTIHVCVVCLPALGYRGTHACASLD